MHEDKNESDKRRKNNNLRTKIDVDENNNEVFNWEGLNEIVAIQEKELIVQANEVNELNTKNSELKARIRALESKIKLREDDEVYREKPINTVERVDKGVPTPNFKSSDRLTQMNWESNNLEHENTRSDTENGEGRRIEEKEYWREQNDMELEDELEWIPETDGNRKRKQKMNEIRHKSHLEECYRRQIGLEVDTPHRIDIFSFKNRRIAWGYQRIVTTCQGMYYEISEDQVDWKH